MFIGAGAGAVRADPQADPQADCIRNVLPSLPATEMRVAFDLAESGAVAGIPDLIAPTAPDAAMRGLYLTLVGALDTCGPYAGTGAAKTIVILDPASGVRFDTPMAALVLPALDLGTDQPATDQAGAVPVLPDLGLKPQGDDTVAPLDLPPLDFGSDQPAASQALPDLPDLNLGPQEDDKAATLVLPALAIGQSPAQPAADLGPGSQDSEAAMGLDRLAYRDVQARLQVAGFDPNGIDGRPGKGTRKAISAWQAAQNLPATGYLSPGHLTMLRDQTETALAAWRQKPENEALINPPPPLALTPRRMAGTWTVTTTCSARSKIGKRRINASTTLRHAGGGIYKGRIKNSLGQSGNLTGQLRGRTLTAEVNWGLFLGRSTFRVRVADHKLTVSGRDSYGCRIFGRKR